MIRIYSIQFFLLKFVNFFVLRLFKYFFLLARNFYLNSISFYQRRATPQNSVSFESRVHKRLNVWSEENIFLLN